MIVTIIIFIVILGLLIFVHEFGHFLVAKRNGVKVEEFGFGFPPRIIGLEKISEPEIEIVEQKEEAVVKTEVEGQTVQISVLTQQEELRQVKLAKKWRLFFGKNKSENAEGTIYSLNSIPLGGFVKIFGEGGEGESKSDSFMSKSAAKKTKILLAGVAMNFIFAWLLFSLGHFIGLPNAIADEDVVKYPNARLQIIGVASPSPASLAGIETGDFIATLKNSQGQTEFPKTAVDFQKFIDSNKNDQVSILIERGKEEKEFVLTPRANPPPGQGPLGVELSAVVNIRSSWYRALYDGAATTLGFIWAMILILGQIIKNLFIQGRAGVELAGPVGIFSLTGQAATLGFIYLLQLTAVLSINLAFLNAVPFPALDGGRVLFLVIEKIKGSPISQKTQNLVNNIGFAVLLLLMVLVTYQDILRLF